MRELVRPLAAWAMLALALALPAVAAPLGITPAAPRALDPVRLQVLGMGTFIYALDATRVSMTDNRIQVVMAIGGAISPVPPPYTVDVLLGNLPAGTYHVDVLVKDTDPSLPFASLDFAVAPRPATVPTVDLTDLWWDPAESGWGLNLVQHSGKVFATWFVYAPDGRPLWYVMPDLEWTGNALTGDVYRTSGPAFGTSFDPSTVQRALAGKATLWYSGAGDSSTALEVFMDLNDPPGTTVHKMLQRQPF